MDVLHAWNDFQIFPLVWIIVVFMPLRGLFYTSAKRIHADQLGLKDGSFVWMHPANLQVTMQLCVLFFGTQKMCNKSTTPTFSDVEVALAEAGRRCGIATPTHQKCQPSDVLPHLRSRRRACSTVDERERLSLQFRKLQTRELRTWRSCRCARLLRQSTTWKQLRHAQSTSQKTSTTPPPDDFADMLGTLFRGPHVAPSKPAMLEENLVTMCELKNAIRNMKANKACDENGLVAELLHHAPQDFLTILLQLLNHVLVSGDVPSTWRKTLCRMLAKTARAKLATDFRPIARLRMLYATFSYLILARIEPKLDSAQPEEQHGFRPKHRLEEHLLTANIMLDKTRDANIPLWLVSLDLSKAFDRVDWKALWQALKDQGISLHMIWILQCLHFDQHGEVCHKDAC